MLAQLPVVGSTVALREAVMEDVPVIVQLLAADQLGSRASLSEASQLPPRVTSSAEVARAGGVVPEVAEVLVTRAPVLRLLTTLTSGLA